MKLITKLFVLAQELDILTTLYGIYFLNCKELNPLGLEMGLALKLVGVIIVCFILEKVDVWPPLIWLVPVIPFITVLWNIINLSL